MSDGEGGRSMLAQRLENFAVTFVPRTKDESEMVPRRGLATPN
jgi:hypothetical protein